MAALLVNLSTPGQLYAAPAASFERCLVDLKAHGIKSGTTLANHAMRPIGQQEAIFFARYTKQASGSGKYGDVRWYRGVRYVRTSSLGPAAIPGTSNHGNGDTVDWQNLGGYGSSTFAKASKILAAHGWNNTEGKRIGESWHWTYVKSNDKHLEDDMPLNDADKAVIKDIVGDALANFARKGYGDSGIATDILAAAGAKPNANPQMGYVPLYVQAIAVGMKSALKTLAALTKAVSKISVGEIDYAALAKAVNDDAAKRLSN